MLLSGYQASITGVASITSSNACTLISNVLQPETEPHKRIKRDGWRGREKFRRLTNGLAVFSFSDLTDC